MASAIMKRCLLFVFSVCIANLLFSAPAARQLQKVPDFARAAALVDGAKLLETPEHFRLLQDLIPGIREKKFSKEDLAHTYLIFASEDLMIYGMVIRKGKGTLNKLRDAFKSNPNTIKLRFEKGEFLSALWSKGCTPALLLPKEQKVLKNLYQGHTVSGAAVIRLKNLPGESARKLLEEFPELKHLELIRINTQGKNLNTGAAFLFDNEKSPAKGFRFLNWGLTFILWHKTGAFRRIRQETEKKGLYLYITDPPAGAIARRVAPTAKKVRRSSIQNLKQIATGIHLYLIENQYRLPPDLNAVFTSYIPTPSVYIAPFDKKSTPLPEGEKLQQCNTTYAFLLPGADFRKIKNPASIPVLMEKPSLLPRKRKGICVSFADGRTLLVKIPKAPRMSCRQAVEALIRRSKVQIPEELQKILLKNASAADTR